MAFADFTDGVLDLAVATLQADAALKAGGTLGAKKCEIMASPTEGDLPVMYGTAELPYVGVKAEPGPSDVVGSQSFGQSVKLTVLCAVRKHPPVNAKIDVGAMLGHVARVLHSLNGTTITNGNQIFLESVQPEGVKSAERDASLVFGAMSASFVVYWHASA